MLDITRGTRNIYSEHYRAIRGWLRPVTRAVRHELAGIARRHSRGAAMAAPYEA